MVYKIYKKVRGKKHGPYFYKTVRTPEGKIKTIYLGKTEEEALKREAELLKMGQKKTKKGIRTVRTPRHGKRMLYWIMVPVLAIIIAGFFLYVMPVSVTIKPLIEIKTQSGIPGTYELMETPEGNYNLKVFSTPVEPEKPIPEMEIREIESPPEKIESKIDSYSGTQPERGKINTPVVAVKQGLTFKEATIILPKTGPVNTIVYCPDFNFETFTCPAWEKTRIPFQETADTISFRATRFSAYGGALIEISKAEHLDENRTLISDIYEQVKALDSIWSEPIYHNEYVRVTFKQALDNTRDITIYARSNASADIEVYRENDDNLITKFENIAGENRYKVYLTNLPEGESYDVFDLKIIGNSVEFDYIVDPAPNITIISPENITYNTTIIDFNVSLDVDGDWCGYSLDSAANVTMNKPLSDTSQTVTLTEGNITYDGFVEGTAVYTIYPDGDGRFGDYGSGWYDRAFIDFNTSSIPDNAVITEVNLTLYISRSTGDTEQYLKNLTQKAQDYGSDAESLYNDIGSATNWTITTAYSSGGTQTVTLENAEGDLQARLSADWFSVGIMTSEDSGGDYGIFYTSEYPSEGKPELTVTYTPRNNTYFYATNSTMTQGSHSVVFSCNDTGGNMSSTSPRGFVVETGNVTACRTLDQANTEYTQTANIEADSDPCINITAENITFNGNGFWIANSSLDGIGIYSNQLNTTIRNCNISMGTSMGGYGIELKGANNSHIFNNTLGNQYIGLFLNLTDNTEIENNSADFILSGQGIYLFSSHNNTLTDNTASYGSYGIRLFSSHNNTLTDNTVSYGSDVGITLSSSNNNTLQNNDASHNYDYDSSGIILTSGSNNNIIINNTANNNTGNGISLSGSNNSILTNNTANSNDYGIRLSSSSNNNVTNNNVSLNDYGIYLSSSSNNTLTNITANSNLQHGIYLVSSSYNNLTNAVSNSNNFHGILLDSSSNNILTNITLNGNAYDGIELDSSSNNILIDSTFYSNNYNGIYLEIGSNNNTFTNNDMWNCSPTSPSYGCITLLESDYNVFDGNRINKSSNYGIWIQSSGSGATDNSDHNLFKNTNMTNIDNMSVFLDDDGSDSENLNNTFLNFTYNNETVDSNSELIRKWYYRAYVNDTAGNNVSNANVSFYDKTNYLIDRVTTNSSGDIDVYDIIDYVNNGEIKTYYSPYTITAVNSTSVGYHRDYNVTSEENKLNDVITIDIENPDVSFDPSTTSSGTQTSDYIFVNVSASDSYSNISTFIDFNNSLVGWWRMDDVNSSGDPTDYTGVNNGTAVDDTSQTDSGYLGKGFKFDGAGDYVDCGNDTSINFDNNMDYTYSAWAYGVGMEGSEEQESIISMEDLGKTKGFSLYHEYGTPNTIRFWEWSTSTYIVLGEYSDNTWYHVAFTYNSFDNEIRVYKNGMYIDSDNAVGIFSNTENFLIGAGITGMDYHWNGTIDDVMIFNRFLSAEEIQALYANKSSEYLTHNFTNLADGAYKFKAYAQDIAGNVNETEEREVTVETGTNVTICRTLDQANTTYTLQNSLSTDDTCFTITGDNITLDGNGFGITGSVSNILYAISVSGRKNITIKNFRDINNFMSAIYFDNVNNSNIKNNTMASSMSSTLRAIHLKNSNNNLIDNNSIDYTGSGSYISCDGIYLTVDSGKTANNNNITNNRIKTSSGSYIATGVYINDNGNSNFNIISNNTFDTDSPNSNAYGVYLFNRGTLMNSNKINNNTFDVDGRIPRGVFIDVESGITSFNIISDNDVVVDSTQEGGYGFKLDNFDTGNFDNNGIINNNFTVHSTNSNAYGITLINLDDTAVDNTVTSGNRFTISSSSALAFGVYLYNIGTSIENILVNDSIFNVDADSSALGVYVYNDGGTSIDLTTVNNSNFEINSANDFAFGIYFRNGGTSVGSNIVYNNIINTTSSVSSSDIKSRGLELRNSDNSDISHNIINATAPNAQAAGIYIIEDSDYNSFWSNAIKGEDYGIYISDSDGNLFQDMELIEATKNDTYLTLSSVDNIFLNVSYDISKEYVASGSELIRKWYYRAYVNDTDVYNVNNANVTAYNTTGDYQFNLTTGSDGYTPIEEIIDYVNTGTRSYYSNYTINASNDLYTYTVSQTYNATTNNLKDVFTLDSKYRNIDSCDILGWANKIYTQTKDITISGDNVKCIDIIAENITFDGNGYDIATLTGGNQRGVYSNQYNTTIKNCNIDITEESGTGIELNTADDSYIYNNTLEVSTGVIAAGNNIRIERNNITDISNTGIDIDGNNNTISDNILYAPFNAYFGITLQGSNNNLTNNTIDNFAAGWGLDIRGSNNHITDTQISNSFMSDVDSDSITNIFLNCTYTTESGSLTRKWYYRAYVNDTAGNNVSNANVTAYNATGDYQFNLTTGSDGYTSIGEITDYVNDGGAISYYSNYTIFAKNSTVGIEHVYYNVTAKQSNLNHVITINNNILSCDNLDVANTEYTQQADIIQTANADCIVISAQNITYNGNSFSITSSQNVSGIFSTQQSTTIRNCNISMGTGSGGYGIELFGADNSYIYNTTLNEQYTGLTSSSMIFGASINIEIKKITANNNSQDGIYIYGGSIFDEYGENITLVDITANNNSRYGINLDEISNSTLTNITANLNDNTGINLDEISNSTLTNITANSNNLAGITLLLSNNNILTNNNLDSNYGGIVFGSSSNNNLANIIASSNAYGIWLSNSDNSNITDSNISSSTTNDAYLDSSSINNIFLNTSYNTSSESVASGSELIRKWYYRAYVNDTNGNNVPNANVSLYNKANDLTDRIVTNSTGWINTSEIIDYVNSGGIRSYYSPYTITAINSTSVGFHRDYNVTNVTNNLNDVITIDVEYPNINFGDNTPADNSTETEDYIYINVSAADSASNISTFIDFDNSLVSWWRMDDVNGSGDPTDYMGRNNGSKQGQASQTDAGKLGKGFKFDGNGDYINCGNDASLLSEEITISAWIKTDYQNPDKINILSYGSGAHLFGIAGGMLGYIFIGVEGAGEPCEFGGSFDLRDGNWHFVAMTRNSTTDNVTAYLDGQYKISGICSVGTLTFDENVNIGRNPSASDYFNGTIDDVMIFNRSLSVEEITALYANQTSRYLTHNFTSLADGNHTFKAYTQDLAGNVNSTEQRTVMMDATPPTWSGNKTNASDTTHTGEFVYFNITLNDNIAGAYSVFSIDDGAGTFTNQSPRAWNSGDELEETAQINATVNQIVRWRWHFNDSIGNWNNTDTWSFTVAGTPPVVNNVNATPAVEGFGRNITLYANVADADGQADIHTVWVNITAPNGISYNLTMTNTSLYIWEVNYTDYVNGTYNFTVYANETSGVVGSTNSSTFNMYINLTINIQTAKNVYDPGDWVNISSSNITNNGPTNTSVYLLMNVQYWSASNGWVFEYNILNDTTPRSITAGETLKIDSLWNTSQPYGGWNVSTRTHGDGTYRAYIAVTDTADNVLAIVNGSTTESGWNFSVNNTAPFVYMPRVYKDGKEVVKIQAEVQIDIRVNVTDPNGKEDISVVRLRLVDSMGAVKLNNIAMANISDTNGGRTYSYTYNIPSNADTGVWAITIYAYDLEGLQDSNSTTFTIIEDITIQVRLKINNIQNKVYIPGTGEVASSAITNRSYSNPTHYYLASYLNNILLSLVFASQNPIAIGTERSGTTHTLEIDHYITNSKLFLVFTKGDWTTINNKISLIEAGTFLFDIMPSFAYGLGFDHIIRVLLTYPDIDIQGEIIMQRGSYILLIEDTGTSEGKEIINIRII